MQAFAKFNFKLLLGRCIGYRAGHAMRLPSTGLAEVFREL